MNSRTSWMLAVFLLGAAAVVSLSPGIGYATDIVCGDCHGVPPADGDNCTDNARELHGTHVNYSSASFPGADDKCAYCHVPVAGTAPTATHIDYTVDIASTKAPSLSYDEPSRTCTDACHANNASTAKWGNYTAVVAENIKLTCNACHDDSSDNTGLSDAHGVHLGTGITVTGLGGGTNADCDACHPDNVYDLWRNGKADDGTKKAYPHASDGTNVDASNVTVDGSIGFTGTNCTGACHSNYTADVWTDTSLTCNSCHYYNSGTIMVGAHSAHVINQAHPCSYCHSVPGAGDTTHVTAMPAVGDNATVIAAPGPNAGASWNDVNNSCSNTGAGCHLSATVWWYGPPGLPCSGCHNYPDGNNWSANNGHAVQYNTATVANTHLPLASAFNDATDDYDSVCADTTKCGKCHYGLTEASNHKKNGVEVVPYGYNYCGVGDFTKYGSGSTTSCDNVSCHSGMTTPQWD